jgi:hypothetical protein
LNVNETEYHLIDIIVTNKSLPETEQWKFRTDKTFIPGAMIVSSGSGLSLSEKNSAANTFLGIFIPGGISGMLTSLKHDGNAIKPEFKSPSQINRWTLWGNRIPNGRGYAYQPGAGLQVSGKSNLGINWITSRLRLRCNPLGYSEMQT